MAKVSVIVPVFNAEKTLIRCLGNLVHQTLDDIELILVNDCSTDGSLQILLDCEAQFSEKVMVVDLSENLGAGGARNVGLSYASGEYVGFVDSDDMVDTTMFEKLYSKAVEGNYDIVDCGFLNENNGQAVILTTDECCGDLGASQKSKLISDAGYLVTKIFRRELWNNLEFRGHAILEDLETLMYLIMKCKRMGNVKEILYKYCKVEGSLSKEMDPKRYHKAMMDAFEAIEKVVMPLDNYGEVSVAVEYIIINMCKSAMVMALKNDSHLTKMERDEHIKNISKVLTKMIKTPIMENHYVRERIPDNETKWLLSQIRR